MDDAYLGRRSNKPIFLGIFIVVVLILAGGVFLWVKSQEKFISPIPPEPSFEVVYYTPTPEPVTPTSSPSATPKVRKAPTATPKVAKSSPTPTGKESAKGTVTPTGKSTSPTPTVSTTTIPTATATPKP